ncbi:MAG: hypothetical protein LBS31_07835, partial [Candidatus Adiutrix sp.]|nr:hypothetical protein [Candidatus Adiutrix sp.]
MTRPPIIAALVDDAGQPASLAAMTAYCLFSRPPGRAWEKQRQVPGNFLDGCAGLAAAREA